MKSRRSSTVRFESTTTIHRPVDEVFARLTDLDGYSTWMHRTGLFGKARQTSEGPPAQGTTYVDRSRMGPFRGEVTVFESPSRIEFSETLRMFGKEMMQARPGYTLEANGTQTIVHHTAEGRLFGAMRIMKPVAGLMAGRERRRTLASLKRSLEQQR